MRCNCHFNHFRDCDRFWDDLMFGRCRRRHRDCDDCCCRRKHDHDCNDCCCRRKHDHDCNDCRCRRRHDRDCDDCRNW
ncbi:hypothetical protein AAIE21_12200 [Paenibacillus sp. 102]|uniref:hypothetical protein n=1 Tax=Paenibacillus sp. 102 TaxID=3120823 RepID=UPI0031BA2D22